LVNSGFRKESVDGYFSSKSYFSSKAHLAESELQKFVATVNRMPSDVVILISAYGGAVNRVGMHATAFVHRDSVYKIELCISAASSRVSNWVLEFVQGPAKLIDNGESYQNNVDGTLQDYLVRYYGENLPKLVELKRKFDPGNFFRFPQSIPTSI